MAVPTRQKTARERWRIEPMRIEDLARVWDIERQSFSTPWPRESFRHELLENKMAHYLVLRREGPPLRPDGKPVPGRGRGFLSNFLGLGVEPTVEDIVGFAGLWLMVDEAHITTLAVAPEWRGRGLGELMLTAMIEKSIVLGANLITLEVRASNKLAQRLYQKYGFYANGVRVRYYSDNGEDAVIMWSEELGGETFRRRLARLKEKLAERLDWQQKF